MKKLTLLALFAALSTALSAQFLVGGQFNLSSIKSTSKSGTSTAEYTTNFVTLLPRFAYAQNNLWFGLDAGVNLINFNSDVAGNTFKSSVSIATIAPFVRYTKRPVDYLGLWIEGQAGASFGSRKNNDGKKTVNYSGINAGFRPGVIVFIGKHLSFEASFGQLGFSSLTSTDANDSNIKTTDREIGLILNRNLIDVDEDNLTFKSGFQFGANWQF
jgi:hypothetical protein